MFGERIISGAAKAAVLEMISELNTLKDENRRLRERLLDEWGQNHAEHCTNVEHTPGQTCYWPMPEELRDYVEDE